MSEAAVGKQEMGTRPGEKVGHLYMEEEAGWNLTYYSRQIYKS